MIKLYSTHCPKCKVLTMKLNQKKIEYVVIDDIEEMKRQGFRSTPMLDVDGTIYDFAQALEWVKRQ